MQDHSGGWYLIPVISPTFMAMLSVLVSIPTHPFYEEPAIRLFIRCLTETAPSQYVTDIWRLKEQIMITKENLLEFTEVRGLQHEKHSWWKSWAYNGIWKKDLFKRTGNCLIPLAEGRQLKCYVVTEPMPGFGFIGLQHGMATGFFFSSQSPSPLPHLLFAQWWK